MKRALSLVLALALMLGLASLSGCAGDHAEETPPTSTGPSSDIPSTSEPSAPDEGYDTDSWPAVNLVVATSGNENDYASKCLTWFCDTVRERSNGKIDFTVHYGGTYCTTPEEYDYVSSGAIDMTLWNQSINASQFPIICYTGLAAGNEEALDLVNYMAYENAETAAIFEKYATEGNIKMLAYLPSGYSLFCANKPISSFHDFSDITFGTMLNAALWTSLGMNVVSCSPADMYESLSRGTIDSACQALPSAVSKMFYEVTDYGLMSGYSSVAYNLIINLDRWNSFSEEQQALINEVKDELATYSVEYYNECQDQWVDTWEEGTGNHIVEMSEEDSMMYVKHSYAINYETYLTFVQNLGIEEDYEAVVDAHSAYFGFDCRTGT